jgi:hypothetical protein
MKDKEEERREIEEIDPQIEKIDADERQIK